MERAPVDSSNLRSIGYDPETQTLEIEFHSGGIYQYFNVPPDIYTGSMNASSHGKYFYEHISDVYRYRRMR